MLAFKRLMELSDYRL